jgi:N-acyl-D-aspartate/D-glutamate deacylase
VTLEVVGNCGFGCFPILDPALAPNAIYGYTPDLPVTWSSAGEYFDLLDAARPAVNVLSLVPNGQLRLSVVGLEQRPADAAERRELRRLLEESLEQGAWGYSTGLEYASEQAATEDEVADLCSVCARRDGLYATHTRRRDAGAAGAVEEAVRTAERAGARLQVSHLVPRNGLESGRTCIECVEAAHARGLDVAFDMHTRLYGTTYLHVALPPWALQGGPSRLAKLLADGAARESLKAYTSILSAGGDWGRVVLLDNEVWPEYARRNSGSP